MTIRNASSVWPRLAMILPAIISVILTAIAAASPPDEPAKGRPIYERHCIGCHGVEGRGDGIQAPFLSPRPSNLVSAAISVKSDQELLKVITNGKPRTDMKGWKDVLSEEDQRHVLSYIRSLIRFNKMLTAPPIP